MFLIYVDKSGDAGVNTVLRIFLGCCMVSLWQFKIKPLDIFNS